MRRWRLFLLILNLLPVLVAGCGILPVTLGVPSTPTGTATVVGTDTVIATGTTASAATSTATATATAAATATSTATAAPTPTPTEKPLTGPRATVLAMAKTVVVPSRTPTPPSAGGAEDPSSYAGIFERAWQIVQENYVRDSFNGIDWEAVRQEYRPQVDAVESRDEFYDIMEAFIAELNDNHSRFVRPDDFALEFDALDPSDALEGVAWTGLRIWPAREDAQLLIWYVCAVGPAADAGLQRGDAILRINDQPVEAADGFDGDLIRQATRGESGSVTLTVQQGPMSKPEDITVAYGQVAGCDGWHYGVLGKDPYIGYVRVPDFGGDADVNILELIHRLEQDRVLDGLIVDVRHNPGGNSDRSIAIFTKGVFGEMGPLREGATQTVYRIRGPVRWNETTPVTVLTDGSSHSAAEYFATAMQQAERGLVVGQPTAGNTEGITGFSLPDGSLIRLAVSTLQLPDGSTLEGTGVIPDIQVPLDLWGLRQVPDVQLRAAYEALVAQ